MSPADLPLALATALAEAREIEAASGGGFSIVGIRYDAGSLTIDVDLDARTFIAAHTPGGLLFEPTEHVSITLPPTFPVGYPRASVAHTRFAGYENVLRGDGLCLFRSPSTDWDPKMGLSGYVLERLWTWFDRVARNDVEQQGGAFHAPTLSRVLPVPAAVVAEASEPDATRPWMGYTRLTVAPPKAIDHARASTPDRVVIKGWDTSTARHIRGQRFGAAVLVGGRLGFEFPDTLGSLLRSLESTGLEPRTVVKHLGRVARAGVRGHPLYFTIGTSMGIDDSRHFLTTLFLPRPLSEALWEAGGTRRKEEAIDRVLTEGDGLPLLVCRSHEARPTVAVRRDQGAPMSWFEGREVAIWGCGAVGGPIAIAIARAGAARLVLRDKGVVSPGLLARQPYEADDVGLAKVDALRHRIRGIRPDLRVEADINDVTRIPPGTDWSDGAEIVIDATAAIPVRAFLDLRRSTPAVPILTVGVDARAERVFARLLTGSDPGSLGDLERDVRLQLAEREGGREYLDGFFPSRPRDSTDPFYPEPGCSESTFVGSAADMNALSAMALNWSARRLVQSQGTSAALLACQPYLALEDTDRLASVQFGARPYCHLKDPRLGFTVHLGEGVTSQLSRAIADARERLGPDVETGGALFGDWDSVRRVVWIDRAGPPPLDSIEAVDRFTCGVEGLAAETERLATASHGAVGFIGTWHTHPRHPPEPSGRDLASLADVFSRPERLPRVFTMLIVGSPHTAPELHPHVFSKGEFRGIPAP
ncbi:ThiF family adenylyltransferase [Rubricoccus marinus]|uniref:JAB domain-containing protein n=1 Tax=Rubricoccus marinus TaxID=716817 RepID=A0A259TU43_9BACT|nr:ThiF family adenylyltransferase [Rubricoccus marinus]OZC01285.1 hypothetical protein BSZ36_17715 [Rubricoccus marinus]